MNLPAYPKYKDSGVAWLGMVPEGWEVKKLRHLLSTPLQYGANEAAEYDIPDWPRYIRITDVTENGELRPETFRSLPGDVAEKYLLSYGDVLFARSGATVGKTFLYKNSWGTCAYAGYLIRAKIFILRTLPEFIKYFTESTCYWQWVASVQIQATIQNISAEKYGDMPLPVPSLSEQEAIAAFLDRETAKIDTLVEKQRRMLDLLKEKRAALISHAVTKGLNPDAKLKDSGVAWLGMVPEGWEVKRLRHVSRFKGGSTPSTDEAIYWEEGVIPWISPKDMKGVSISQTEDYLTPTGANQCASGILNPDHVLIVVRSGILRHTIPVAINTVPACINQDIRAFILKDSKSSEYFKWFILGNQRALIDIWCKQGTTVESIEMNYLKDSCIAIPPLPEQQAIAAFLARETVKIDTLAARIEDMIAKLQEYRTALITAAVTGKVNVQTCEVDHAAIC